MARIEDVTPVRIRVTDQTMATVSVAEFLHAIDAAAICFDANNVYLPSEHQFQYYHIPYHGWAMPHQQGVSLHADIVHFMGDYPGRFLFIYSRGVHLVDRARNMHIFLDNVLNPHCRVAAWIDVDHVRSTIEHRHVSRKLGVLAHIATVIYSSFA